MGPLSDGYQASRRRIAELAPGHEEVPVPACPDWTVHDLVAHLSGSAETLVTGDRPGPDPQPWIDRIIAERRQVALSELLARWEACATAFSEVIEERSWGALADVVVHEHDLRGALGRPGARDGPEVAEVVGLFLRVHRPHLEAAGLAPLEVRTPTGTWSSGHGQPGCVLAAGTWEATRLLASRRTADEVRDAVAEGDVEPYLAVLADHAPLPTTSLAEDPGGSIP